MTKYFFVLCIFFFLPGCRHLIISDPILFDQASFVKPKENPILYADSTFLFFDSILMKSVAWQKADVFNPAAIVKDEKVYLLYRSEDNPAAQLGGRTSRIGLAISEDGFHFTKSPQPVLFPRRDSFMQYDYPGGCEDPRVAETSDGMYVMAYTSWNNKLARLSIAFSTDLIHWEKKGPAFAKAYSGKYLNTWSKSGSMITSFVENKQVLTRINEKYWMYWGEQFVNLAWSDNLIDWYPTEDSTGHLKPVISPRENYFDSHLTECGPPAIMTSKGITLIYNGKNLNDGGASTDIPKGTYSMGYVILDPAHPEKVLSRSEQPFLIPTLRHEKTGQYEAGTTFAEGWVLFKARWFLYYGTADSYVGLAISKETLD